MLLRFRVRRCPLNLRKPGVARRISCLFAIAVTVIGLDVYLVERHVSRDDIETIAVPRSALVAYPRNLPGGDDRPTGPKPSYEVVLETVGKVERALTALEAGSAAATRASDDARAVGRALSDQRAAWDELKPLLIAEAAATIVHPGAGSGHNAAAARLGGVMASGRRLSRLEGRRGAELERGVSRLMVSSVALIEAFETLRAAERRRLRWHVGLVSFAGLIALGFALRSTWKDVVAPLARLRRSVAEAPGSELGRGADVVRANDVEALDDAVTRMSCDLVALRRDGRRAEAELRRAEANYASVFDNAVVGILRAEADGKPRAANGFLAAMLGYTSPKELLERVDDVNEQIFVTRNDRPRRDPALLEPGEVDPETRVRRKDGSTIPALSSARESREGEVALYDYVIVDVTPLESANESLRDLSGKLLRSQDDERRRVARELHDSTGQLLAALEMNLGRLDELLPDLRESVSSSVDIAGECSRQLRSMSYLLHPPMLEDMGLVHALRTFVKGFSSRCGVPTRLDSPASFPRLARDAELALFRVTQEALTNVQRHAESPDAVVRLSASDETIRLEIEDHGRGTESRLRRSRGDEDLPNEGVGMRGMAERLRPFDGRLTIDSHPGRTVVRAELSLRKASHSTVTPDALD